MIRSFGDKDTEKLYHQNDVRKFRAIEHRARSKLEMLDAANTLSDLRAPPGNRLEALKGDRKGQYSIRIDKQWRIVFSWSSAGPENVSILDYH